VFLSPFVWRERLPIHCRTRYAFSIAAPLGKRLRPRPNTGGLNAGRRAPPRATCRRMVCHRIGTSVLAFSAVRARTNA